MASTGEVACFGDTLEEALYKSILSSGALSDKKSALLSLGGVINKKKLLESAKRLAAEGYQIYATGSTSVFLFANGIKNQLVHKVYQGETPNVTDVINKKKVGFVINLSERNGEPEKHFKEHLTDGYYIRRASVDGNIPLFTDLQLARLFVRALTNYQIDDLKIKSWREYHR